MQEDKLKLVSMLSCKSNLTQPAELTEKPRIEWLIARKLIFEPPLLSCAPITQEAIFAGIDVICLYG